MSDEANLKGWLFKWTNYLKGYQRRWFVLSNGYLSYYRSQQEMSYTCRGTINVSGAEISFEDRTSFTVTSGSNIAWHLKATSEVERQRWIHGLELARAGQPRFSEEQTDSDSEGEDGSSPDGADLKQIANKLNDLKTCHELIKKHASSLQRVMADMDKDDDKIRMLQEKTTLFMITAEAMNVAANEFVNLAKNSTDTWQKSLASERSQRLRLEQTIEALAIQQNALERDSSIENNSQFTHASVIKNYAEPMSESDDEFHDCETDDGETESTGISVKKMTVDAKTTDGKRKRRTAIPDKPDKPLNLWSIMRSCIGKDLSKIPMPVNFNEPLSMLQRITEDFEYHDYLDRAAAAESVEEQLALVSAFSVSSYASTIIRTTKPFNPLLGETYELNREEEIGLRLIVEQVSHHPPVAAFHAISSRNGGWELFGEMMVSSKFRGKYLSVMPQGSIHVKFNNNGQHYHWSRVTTTVHNIIVGKLWIEQSGEYDVASSITPHKCSLKYHPYSYFSREPARKVTGTIFDASGKAKKVITGTWDDHLDISDVTKIKDAKKEDYVTTSATRLWKKNPLPKGAEKMYHFSEFTVSLNEMEEGIAPTDSRIRKDQQLMEETLWDEANAEKQRLEQAQRERRKLRTTPWEPIWFKEGTCKTSGLKLHLYQGEYWEKREKQDWSKCPTIFE